LAVAALTLPPLTIFAPLGTAPLLVLPPLQCCFSASGACVPFAARLAR
jgi:hypothetical protein